MQSTSNNSQVLLTRSMNLNCDFDAHVGSPSQVAAFDMIEDRITRPTSKNSSTGRSLVIYTDSLQMFSDAGTASVEEHIATNISTDDDCSHFKDVLVDNERFNAENHASDSRETDDNDRCGGDGSDAVDDNDVTRETSETNGLTTCHCIIEQSSPQPTSSSPPTLSSSSSSSDNAIETSKNNDELNCCPFKTILCLDNSQETTFFEGNDDGGTELSSANGKAFKLLKTLHLKSVSTETDDATSDLKDGECQCYPEEFFNDEQEEELSEATAKVEESPTSKKDICRDFKEAPTSPGILLGMTKLDVIRMKQELLKAEEKIQALDSTMRKMRAEKLDLLGQMKHLYATLENKEEDMNSFVKNFEMKISEGNDLISRLITEKTQLEKTNQDIEMKLQNALDQCVSLNLDLDLKNQVIEQLNLQLESSQVSRSDSNLSNIKMPCITIETNFPRSPTDAELLKTRDWQNGVLGESLISSEGQEANPEVLISKGVDDHNKSLVSRDGKGVPNLNDVLQIHISQWKANHILTWLEQDLNMGYYSQQCKENVKSGKVLLTMTDQELDSAFGLQSPIHRKKLRIAIDHLSDKQIRRFPLAEKLTSSWITGEWLPGLGLPQFGPVFEAQLVDGRILDHISAKELEKNFTMISKTHVSSILAGIELLRLFDFDKKKLEDERKVKNRCLLWTNADVIHWLEDIDLQEYAPNLNKSGIHGALLVLDEKFSPAILAAEMGLPSSKSYLIRHLIQEYKDVVDPAKSEVYSSYGLENKTRTLSRALSSSSKARRDDLFSSSMSFKGSLGRAFGKKMKKEFIQVVPTSEPLRMPTELLSLFDSPNNQSLLLNDSNSIISNPCSTSASAFSSLQSLPISTMPNIPTKTDMTATVPSTLSTVITLDDASKLAENRAPARSESSKSQKSKTPKSNKSHHFSLRAFSTNSRRKSSGVK